MKLKLLLVLLILLAGCYPLDGDIRKCELYALKHYNFSEGFICGIELDPENIIPTPFRCECADRYKYKSFDFPK